MRSNRIRRKFFVLENINFAIRTYCDTAFASKLTKSQQSKFFVLENINFAIRAYCDTAFASKLTKSQQSKFFVLGNINFYEYSKILFCSAGRAPPK